MGVDKILLYFRKLPAIERSTKPQRGTYDYDSRYGSTHLSTVSKGYSKRLPSRQCKESTPRLYHIRITNIVRTRKSLVTCCKSIAGILVLFV